MATPASLAELVIARGAPDRVYVASADDIWAITSGGDATRIFETMEGERLLAFDPAPGARQVAVLVESEGERGRENVLLILDDQGEEQRFISEFVELAGTPGAGAAPGVDLVDWSPQGRRVLVALRDGSTFVVDLTDGASPELIDLQPEGSAVLDPAWSPTGEAIAYIAERDAQQRTLNIHTIASGLTEAAVRPPGGRLVIDFSWMPDGVSLLFTEGGNVAGAISGIDLWRIDASGENRALVASAGSVAPIARIADAVPSPDGQRVAYAVLIPGSGAPVVDSVWLRDLNSGIGFKAPLPPVESIEDIWWTDQGLVISAITRGSTQDRRPVLALLNVNDAGATEILWAAPIATPTAARGTPMATPARP